MNTGKIIETSSLYLIPGKNSRDDEAFIKMLRRDGNFRKFTGLEFKEKHLEEFRNYFERKGNCECIYSIYRKNKKDFIGYVGFHKEINFEIEFYISKPERRRGYAKEACIEIINLFFTEGLSIDNKIIKKGEIYAVTLTDNIATIELLIKLGFKRYVSEEGETVTMRIFFDEDVDEILSYCTSTYVLKKENYNNEILYFRPSSVS